MWDKKERYSIYKSVLNLKDYIKTSELKDIYEKYGYEDVIGIEKIWDDTKEDFEDVKIDDNLVLAEFYSKLLIEKIGRLPIIGEMSSKEDLNEEVQVTKIGDNNIYNINIPISHDIKDRTIDFTVSALSEIKQLEDDVNVINLTLEDDFIILNINVNADDIQNLDSANKAFSKFNL